MSNQERCDGLSNLPLSIILDILGRVSIRDAIRTCVLSKQWRYIWDTLPHLDFDFVEVGLKSIAKDGLMKEYTESTENFISDVLIRHKGPIHRFKIKTTMDFNIDSIEKWILCLSRKDIRELNIRLEMFSYDNYFAVKNLKSSIYSCLKLTKLCLEFFIFHPPPSSFKGFLALKTLLLVGIEISTDLFESLVACCPLLEELHMSDCSCSEVRIHSPNLKDFYLFGEEPRELCLYAPLLAKMYVSGCSLSIETQTLVCNYTNLLGCFTNLVELVVGGCFIRYLCDGIDDFGHHHNLVLPHLMSIELLYMDLANGKEISFLARLILGSPNLYKLIIDADKIEDRSDAPSVSFEDFGYPPNFTLGNLRYVSLYDVCDYHFGMHLIELLLECSPVLETLNVNLVSPKVTVELLGFSRASPYARILARTE